MNTHDSALLFSPDGHAYVWSPDGPECHVCGFEHNDTWETKLATYEGRRHGLVDDLDAQAFIDEILEDMHELVNQLAALKSKK